MGRERFRIVSSGKTSIVKLDSNPMLGQLKRMLTACMTGDVATLKEGSQLSFSDKGDSYAVTVTPDNRRAKNMVKLITLTFEKQNMSLTEMKMEEASGDVSLYRFYNKKFNKGIDPAHFEIR
jgi:outer membrane lipoprotein-sorting protein